MQPARRRAEPGKRASADASDRHLGRSIRLIGTWTKPTTQRSRPSLPRASAAANHSDAKPDTS
eukprot:9477593-Pyramimonas_sp.AAC.1